MSITIGIDLTSVAAVEDSVRLHGERYLKRVYTDYELRDCDSQATHLAARFAAKEATMKALGREDEPLAWSSIGVRRDSAGRPSIELRGNAAALARRRGVVELTVSLSHEGPLAAAVVVAQGTAVS